MADQTIKPDQRLDETWTVTYSRAWHRGSKYGGPHEARLYWPHQTHYCLAGRGDSIEAARLDLITRLAAAIADDPNARG